MNPGPAITVHVVLVHYNSADDLDRCLSSFAGDPRVTITVVDNGSRPEERDRARDVATRASARMVESPTNLGFGAGANLGIRAVSAADSDVLWILNPDAAVLPGCIDALIAAFENEQQPALVSPMVTKGVGDEIWFAGGVLDRARGVTHHVGQAPVDPITSWSFISGAAIAARARDWTRLGGFREDLFLYWEDTDLSLRAAHEGFTLCVVRDAVVWHRVGGSSTDESDSGKSAVWYYFLARNRLIVCADGWDRLTLLLVRGWRPTAGLLVAAAREHASRGRKLRFFLLGCVDGVRARTAADLARLTAIRRAQLGIADRDAR